MQPSNRSRAARTNSISASRRSSTFPDDAGRAARGVSGSAADEIVRLLDISEGRAFCLFTSYAQMKDVHERVAKRVGFPLLLQGTAPRSILLDRFRSTPNAVLFATSSFWQGVDVPGAQLSCVIIDKLPFAVPSDPIVAARVRALARGRPQRLRRISSSRGSTGSEAGLRPADSVEDGSRDSLDPR